jgi:hypothetical protein
LNISASFPALSEAQPDNIQLSGFENQQVTYLEEVSWRAVQGQAVVKLVCAVVLAALGRSSQSTPSCHWSN